MSEYIATFHTHLAALLACRALDTLGVNAKMMPVPRAVSSSCGTCVRYSASRPHAETMGEDAESIYIVCGGKKEEYELVTSFDGE